MRFTSRSKAKEYYASQPQRIRNRMITVPVKVWDSSREEWVDRWDVVLTPPEIRPPSKRRNRN